MLKVRSCLVIYYYVKYITDSKWLLCAGKLLHVCTIDEGVTEAAGCS